MTTIHAPSLERIVAALRSHGLKVTEKGATAQAQCPAHDDRTPSLSLRQIDEQALICCHAGCRTEDVLAAVGLTMRDLFDEPRGASYRYTDATGASTLRTVHRSPDKRFRQDVRDKSVVPLYRLPRVVEQVGAGGVVMLCEGEKDVHALESLGIVATTAPQGATNFRHVDVQPLAGAHVLAVVDQDAAGQQWARQVAEHVGAVARVEFIAPAAGKDAADHVAAGYGIDDFRDVAPVLPDEPAQEATDGPQEHEQAPGATWADVDLSDVVAGVLDGSIQRPAPALGNIADAGALLYPGKVHGVHGMGGSGKTWLAAYVLAERIRAGEHVILVDLEDTPATIVERLVVDLQVPAADVVERLHYKRPTETARVGRAWLHETVVTHAVTLAVIDSVGEALAVDGVKANEDGEVAAWMAGVARSTAELGPAVLLLDHVPKADEKALMPIGSQRKQAAMNGAIYSVQVARPFARDKAGAARVVCGKDRQGAYTRGQVVAELRLTPADNRTTVELVAAEETSRTADGSFRPTHLMERVSRFLEAGGPTSSRGIRDGVTGKKDYITAAVATLVAEGYVTTTSGVRGAIFHTSAKPYREDDSAGGQSSGRNDRDRPLALKEGARGPVVSPAPGAGGGRSGASGGEA